MLRRVVLPAPEGPRIASTCPARTSAVIPLSSRLGTLEPEHSARESREVGLPSLVTVTVYVQSVKARCGPDDGGELLLLLLLSACLLATWHMACERLQPPKCHTPHPFLVSKLSGCWVWLLGGAKDYSRAARSSAPA